MTVVFVKQTQDLLYKRQFFDEITISF